MARRTAETESLWQLPLTELRLSVGLKRIITAAGFTTLGEVLDLNDEQLTAMFDPDACDAISNLSEWLNEDPSDFMASMTEAAPEPRGDTSFTSTKAVRHHRKRKVESASRPLHQWYPEQQRVLSDLKVFGPEEKWDYWTWITASDKHRREKHG